MSYRIRKFNNSILKGSNLKFAYAHNLTPQELQNITDNYSDIKKNNDTLNKGQQIKQTIIQQDQQQQQPPGMPNTNVYIKAKLVSKDEKKFDMIRNTQHNQLKLFDSEKYMECEADAIFSNRNKNNEIYDRLQPKINECLQKKQNYTFLLLGTPNTGKNHLLLNRYLLDCYGNPQLTSQIRDQQGGIVQRALSDICTHLKSTNEEDKEVMISIVGFCQDRVIDLLNLDQNLESIQKDNLKIKTEENMGISVEDLIQMSIWSFSEFVSVYRIYSFMKKILKEQIGMHIKSVAIQICIAKVSKQKDFIERIEQKFTFLKMTNCAQNLENISNLTFCMESLKKNSTSIPYRQKRLTFFLKDVLNANSHFTLFQTVSNSEYLKSQLSTVNVAAHFNKKILFKKNYLYDKEFLEYLQKDEGVQQNKQLFIGECDTSVNTSINNTNREISSKNDMKKYINQYKDLNQIDLNTTDPTYHIRAETFSSYVKKRDRCGSIPTNQRVRLDKLDKTSLSPKNSHNLQYKKEDNFITSGKVNENMHDKHNLLNQSGQQTKKNKNTRERIAGIYDLSPLHKEEILGKNISTKY